MWVGVILMDTYGWALWKRGCLGNLLKVEVSIWVCLKIGYIPNEIAIFHRDNDH